MALENAPACLRASPRPTLARHSLASRVSLPRMVCVPGLDYANGQLTRTWSEVNRFFALLGTAVPFLVWAGNIACTGALGFDEFQEGVCLQGAKQCSGNTPQACVAGQWEDDAAGPCSNQTCVNGTCEGACAPGKRCVGAIVQTCNSLGEWTIETTCAAAQVCIAGKCIAECVQGDLRCFNNALQTCDANGLWGKNHPCVGSTCNPITATCVGVCEHKQSRCLGNIPQTCNVNGQWIGDEPCLGEQVCSEGMCIATSP